MVGPFIFLDEMGPVDLAPGIPRSVDVRPHPHIGLATVTYLFAGEIMHRDSVGSEQPIRPGEVNWMTAGRGITHSERFERARAQGDRIHGIQSWVALPDAYEETDPAFAHYGANELPLFEEAGVWARVIAGEALGAASPVRTYSPLFYVHARLEPGGRIEVPPRYAERAAFIVTGSLTVDEKPHDAGRMLVFETGRMAPMLFHGLAELGIPVICIESRQAYQALKTLTTHKTDRNDARGLTIREARWNASTAGRWR